MFSARSNLSKRSKSFSETMGGAGNFVPVGMKLPAPPNVSEKDFERLLKLERAENTTLRHYGEMWKASGFRRGAEITRLLTRDVEREKEMSVLRERNSKWET